MAEELVLVICKDDDGVYRVTTRQLMTEEDAFEYATTCAPHRDALIVYPGTNWNLRRPGQYGCPTCGTQNYPVKGDNA